MFCGLRIWDAIEPQTEPLSTAGETGDCVSDPGIEPEVQRYSLGTEGLLLGEIALSSLMRLICPYREPLGWRPVIKGLYIGESGALAPSWGVVRRLE